MRAISLFSIIFFVLKPFYLHLYRWNGDAWKAKSQYWLTGPLLCLVLIACEQSATPQNFVVGIINPNPALDDVAIKFQERLSEQLRQDGNTVSYIQPKIPHITEIDNALNFLKKRDDLDLIFTLTSPATIRAKAFFACDGVPIIFGPIYDPVRAGVMDRLVNHHCNITGIKVGGSNPKALEWLLTVSPNVKNILVPFSNLTVVEKFSLADLKQAAEKIGVKLVVVDVKTRQELEDTLNKPPKDVDAIWLLHSAFLVPNSKLYIEAAIRHKIPVASGTTQQNAGIMVTYGQHHATVAIQAARLAYQILNGVHPSDLPVETADFFLGINLHSAEAAGIKVSHNVLLQAQDIVRQGDADQ